MLYHRTPKRLTPLSRGQPAHAHPVAPRAAVGPALVVEAQPVENRGVQVVNVDIVLQGGEARVIRRALA